jgi:hypothetical protein
MFYVEISDSWLRQEVWSSDIYEQSLILVWVQKNGHSYERQQKKARSKTRFAHECEQRKAHYDVSGRSNFPIRDGNGIYPSALEGTGIFFLFPTCEDTSHLQADTLNKLANRRELCTLQILNHIN